MIYSNKVNVNLVVKTKQYNYRDINIGDVVSATEYIVNQVTTTQDSEVYIYNPTSKCFEYAREASRVDGVSTYYGRILVIQHEGCFMYVWAGKNRETNQALQWIKDMSQAEFDRTIGIASAINDDSRHEASATYAEIISTRKDMKASPAIVARRYKQRLENKKAGAFLIAQSELLKDFGYSRAKKNNSILVQKSLDDIGIAVFPDIYQNNHDRLLLTLKSGPLHSHMSDLPYCNDPYALIEYALERSLP